jgi:hypothetical protein
VEVGDSARGVDGLSVGAWEALGDISEQVEALVVVLSGKVLDEEVLEVFSVEPRVKVSYCQLWSESLAFMNSFPSSGVALYSMLTEA